MIVADIEKVSVNNRGVMFPSLRIGYLVAPRDLAEVFIKGRILVDTLSSTIPQVALADFINPSREYSTHSCEA
jgi:DNA-binding transcriptional MocR family regulator